MLDAYAGHLLLCGTPAWPGFNTFEWRRPARDPEVAPPSHTKHLKPRCRRRGGPPRRRRRQAAASSASDDAGRRRAAAHCRRRRAVTVVVRDQQVAHRAGEFVAP